MSKCEVIKKIISSNTIDDNVKVYSIEMFLKGWLTEEDLKWIWNNN